MRKKGVASIGVIGILVITLSLATFFLMGIERGAVSLWAISFLLLSEVVLIGGIIGLRLHGKLFLQAGIGTTLLLYFLATLISVLFAGALRERLNMFILIELGIIAVSAVIAVLILAFAHRMDRSSEEDIEKIETTQAKRGGF